MSLSIVNLRATVAMREEDARIARKHRDEAAARPWSRENQRAYEGARDWANQCGEREAEARGRLIRALEADGAAARRDAAMEACKYCGPDEACPRHSGAALTDVGSDGVTRLTLDGAAHLLEGGR
jgi:hypothetical protein